MKEKFLSILKRLLEIIKTISILLTAVLTALSASGCSAFDFECHGEYCVKASK